MNFDWQQFLQVNNIEFVRQGHDNIGVECPFCGSEGRRFHLAISTRGKGWHCWRRPDFRGVAPHKLIMELIKCSFSEAQKIVTRDGGPTLSESTFLDGLFRQIGVSHSVTGQSHDPQNLEFLDEFAEIRDTGFCRSLVFPYFNKRGYSN